MLPELKKVLVPDLDHVEKVVNYSVWYETHPLYRHMPMKHIKKSFDFEAGDSVPDIAIVKIDTSLDEFDKDVVKHIIKENEGIENNEDIVFE